MIELPENYKEWVQVWESSSGRHIMLLFMIANTAKQDWGYFRSFNSSDKDITSLKQQVKEGFDEFCQEMLADANSTDMVYDHNGTDPNLIAFAPKKPLINNEWSKIEVPNYPNYTDWIKE